MLLPEVPSDISHTAEKSHLFLSLLEFPIPPPNPQRASDVSVHAIPSLIKEVTVGQPRSQTPLTTKYQHTLCKQRESRQKHSGESHSPSLHHDELQPLQPAFAGATALLEPKAGCYQATREQDALQWPHAYHNFKTSAGSPPCFSLTCPGSGTCMTRTACQRIF